MTFVVFLPFAFAASNLQQIPILSSQCHAGKENSCRALGKLAVEDKDPRVRSAATRELTDQQAVEGIAVRDADTAVTEVAFHKLIEMANARVGKGGGLSTVGNPWGYTHAGVWDAAAAKVTDQPLLAQIAVELAMISEFAGGHKEQYAAVLNKISDQHLLTSIAIGGRDLGAALWLSVPGPLRDLAAKKVTDESLRTRIAESKLADEQRTLANHLAAEAEYAARSAKCAIEGPGLSSRLVCISGVSDQALLAKLAVEDKNFQIRAGAVEKITDQSLLSKIALEDSDTRVRAQAAGRLSDETLLAKLAVGSSDPAVRGTAVKHVTDQALLAKIAVQDSEWMPRRIATQQIADQSLLAKLAREDPDSSVRRIAAGRLSDQALRKKLERHASPNLPFQAIGLTVSPGGSFSTDEDGQVTHATGMALTSLRLGQMELVLRSTSVSSDMMIATRDYGDLQIEWNFSNGGKSYLILLTQEQDDTFTRLCSQNKCVSPAR